MVPGYILLIYIGYKYTMQKILSFVASEDGGITNYGITYLSKYPYPFSNVAIRRVDNPLVMNKLFGFGNYVEPHNKSRQSDLVMEKYRVL